MITDDRNDPETVSWLDTCRYLRRELSDEAFEDLIPELIALGQELENERARKGLH